MHHKRTVQSLLILLAVMSVGLPALAQQGASNTTDIQKLKPAQSVHQKRKAGSDVAKAEPATPSSALPTPATLGPAQTTLTTLTLEADPRQATISIGVDGRGRLRSYVLHDPPRIVIEGDRLHFAAEIAQAVPTAGSLVVDFRFGLIDATQGRIVFELARPVVVQAFDHVPGAVRLRITARDNGAASDQATDQAMTLDLARPGAMPAPSLGWTPTTNTADSAPRGVARRPVIVLDPGHGGKDPGAIAAGNIYEKDIVLAVAKQLQAALQATGRYEVRLTRDGDQSVTLDRRLAVSRAAQADLFLSLHADTFPHAQARGGSVYTLTEQATSKLAAALADKENAADQRLGLEATPSTGDIAVDSFLNALTMRETTVFAASLQSGLIAALKGSVQLSRDPARGAAFKVLRQASTPAVLIELGYLSHKDDVVQLQSPQWQVGAAAAITRAVNGYFAKRPKAVVGR